MDMIYDDRYGRSFVRTNGSLAHYGISGQKWHVRRFQNEDGSLTPEGQERYGQKKDRGDQGLIKKWTFGNESGNYAFAKWRERRHIKNLDKAQKSGDEKRIEKYQSKLDAQSAANRNLDAYRRHSSTAKLVMQNLGPIALANAIGKMTGKPAVAKTLTRAAAGAGSSYRHARARGESRLGATLEALPGVGLPIRMLKDKKAYGKYIVFAAPSVDEYYADRTDD